MANLGNQKRVFLHEEIKDILAEYRDGLTISEIARLVNERGRYHKRDGSAMQANQISARVNKRPHLFERKQRRIYLRNDAG